MTENEFAYKAKILCAKLLMLRSNLTNMNEAYNSLCGIYNSIGETYIAHFTSFDSPVLLVATWCGNKLTAGLYELMQSMEDKQ